MQPNVIDLTVDPLNNGTTEVQSFRRFTDSENRSLYIGDDHSSSLRDTLTLLRTLPKPNGTFKGVMKTAAKFTMDTTVPSAISGTNVIAPIIFEVSCSVPVGCDAAVAKVMRQRVIALMDQEAVAANLVELQEI